MSARLSGIALIFALLAYLATGWTNIAPGEAGVVRRLGRVLSPPWGPGPHLAFPIGIDRVDRVRIDAVRRLEVGLAPASRFEASPGSGEFLTGDLNIVMAGATVQYRVEDPVAFVLIAGEVEPILKRLADSSLSEALAGSGVDASLGEGRATLAIAAARTLDRLAKSEGLGVSILGVSLTDARPPLEVAPDFAAAQSARSDHDRRLNEAKTYAATTLTKAESLAKAKIEQASAHADRVVAIAKSKAARFVGLLTELNKSRSLTIRRIYLDALREMLPRVRRKLVLTPEEPVDLSVFGEK